MLENIGSTIGTVIIVAFGALIAFGLPALMERQGGDRDTLFTGDLPIGKWLRILGVVVMIVGVVQILLVLL
jgi:hypothetical protein